VEKRRGGVGGGSEVNSGGGGVRIDGKRIGGGGVYKATKKEGCVGRWLGENRWRGGCDVGRSGGVGGEYIEA